jgi:type VI secretion system protein VasJ
VSETQRESASAAAVDGSLLVPISPDAPAGTDLSYDPEFERLVAEIEKLTSLAGESPDWTFIRSESERTLRDKAKDLRVMSWHVAAKANVEGWTGIVSGLATYHALAKEFWPSLFPPAKRLRARAGQVEWLWGVLAKRIAALPTAVTDVAAVRSLEAQVPELSAFFSEQLKDTDPGMGSVRSALREKIRQLPEPPPAPVVAAVEARPVSQEVEAAPATTRQPQLQAEATATSTNGAAAATYAPAPVAAAKAIAPPELAAVAIDASALANLDQAQDAARGLRDSLMTLAHHGRQVAPSSAWSYRLLRIAAWLTVERAPEAEGGKTPLRAPKQQDRDLLESLRAAGQWDGLLAAAEEAAATHVFWLDPHRMTALALEHKGAPFAQARQIVCRETAAFVERVPGVQHLLYSNGTPFASPETVDWIVAQQRSSRDGRGQGGGDAGTDDALDALLAQLAEQRSTGSAADALATALAEAERLPSIRSRFRAHLAIAREAQAADHLDIALALHERLLPQITPTLEQWEPHLSAEALANHLKVLRAFSRNESAAPADRAANERKEASLFQRLLALDPHAALRLRA